MPSLEADSQFNFMTQPPNILMATESEDAGETRGEQGEVTAADREQTIPIASVSAPDQTAESIPSRRSIGPHPPFASSDEEENIAPLTQNIPKDLNMGARKGRSKDDRPKGRKRNDSIVSAKTVSTVTRSKRDLPPSSPRPDRLGEDGHLSANNQGTHRPPPSSGSSLSGRLLELVESMPVIPPEAFRGLICRNNDDEIASIMERRHPLVRKFISTRDAATGARKKRRTKEAIKSPKRSISKSRASSHQPSSKRPLLDRHDSAERIAWSPSAHGSPSPLKDDPMRPPLRNPTPPDRPVIAVDKIRVAPRSPSFTTVTGAGAAVTSSFSPLPGGEPRRRRKWSEDETAALICGYNRYGPDWRHILQTYGHHFDRRSNVDLKDRARILKRQGLIK